jgi:hypothetical protein
MLNTSNQVFTASLPKSRTMELLCLSFGELTIRDEPMILIAENTAWRLVHAHLGSDLNGIIGKWLQILSYTATSNT